MLNSDLIVGLDIGTTKIACLVGVKNEHGKIEILGVGRAPSLGVRRGVVANMGHLRTASVTRSIRAKRGNVKARGGSAEFRGGESRP